MTDASTRRRGTWTALRRALLTILCLFPLSATAARAEPRASVDAIVQVTATVPNSARTARSLGTMRQGTGVVIDDSGLVLTIGYLILEAIEVSVRSRNREAVPASIVAYDHESGFGLVRTTLPLAVEPIALGSAAGLAPSDPLLVVSHVEEFDASAVYLVDRREFAGYWEYLLEDALFTAPTHGQFGGAALIDRTGHLVGIGSLAINDVALESHPVPGNMFVPIDDLKPILADLLSRGRRAAPARPWLGLFFEEHRGRVFVTRVAPEGPGQAAGIQADDVILGIEGDPVFGLADFYRKLWQRGDAGIEVSIDVLEGAVVRPTVVKSGNRYRYLHLDPTY